MKFSFSNSFFAFKELIISFLELQQFPSKLISQQNLLILNNFAIQEWKSSQVKSTLNRAHFLTFASQFCILRFSFIRFNFFSFLQKIVSGTAKRQNETNDGLKRELITLLINYLSCSFLSLSLSLSFLAFCTFFCGFFSCTPNREFL